MIDTRKWFPDYGEVHEFPGSPAHRDVEPCLFWKFTSLETGLKVGGESKTYGEIRSRYREGNEPHTLTLARTMNPLRQTVDS